jgi:DNA polymerase elongation subunit (family B)
VDSGSVTQVIEAASFVDSNGKSTVLLRSDFQDSEKRLLLHISSNNLESIVSLGQKGLPYIKGRKHIDLCNVYRKMMVQVTIYNNSYRAHKLDEVSKVLLGHGKYKNFSGLDFKNLPIEEQIEYSLRDSELVMDLSKHENYEVLHALYAVSEITELDYEQVCRTNLSTWWGENISYFRR